MVSPQALIDIAKEMSRRLRDAALGGREKKKNACICVARNINILPYLCSSLLVNTVGANYTCTAYAYVLALSCAWTRARPILHFVRSAPDLFHSCEFPMSSRRLLTPRVIESI